MRIATLLALASLALPLAACGDPAEEADNPEVSETAIPVEPDGGIGDGAGPPDASPSASPTGGDEAGARMIPAALQGRWGMVPGDCTSTRGDAKGLIVIDADSVKFYESRATLELETARSESMIRGQWEYNGEGQTWTRDETLSVKGDTLTRTSSGGDEPGSKGPFTYTRCAA